MSGVVEVAREVEVVGVDEVVEVVGVAEVVGVVEVDWAGVGFEDQNVPTTRRTLPLIIIINLPNPKHNTG